MTLKSLLEKIISAKLFFKYWFWKYDLIIYDDLFPHPSSGYRYEEHKEILKQINNSVIYLDSKSYSILCTDKMHHRVHISNFLKEEAKVDKKQLKIFRGGLNINTKLFYCIFLNNIYTFINLLETKKIPFVFTLYPGGGFSMNEAGKEKLQRVLSSKMFRKVIVTQNVTKNFLLDNKLCNEDSIVFIFGCVTPQKSILQPISHKKWFQNGKNTLDVCFCAAKYMEKGLDKGYDLFIEAAHILYKRYKFIQFHIVGGFNSYDINISSINDRVTFYGYQPYNELSRIFEKVDIIVSPNRCFKLGDGLFDGFPLGTVVEAALSGVVALVSDDLNQNILFEDQEDLIIIRNDVDEIVKNIELLIDKPQRIVSISKSAKNKFGQIYSNHYQIDKRIEILKYI